MPVDATRSILLLVENGANLNKPVTVYLPTGGGNPSRNSTTSKMVSGGRGVDFNLLRLPPHNSDLLYLFDINLYGREYIRLYSP